MTDERTKRRTAFRVAALLVAMLCVVIAAACWLRTAHTGDGGTEPTSTQPVAPPTGLTDGRLFHGWPRPDFVLMLTAQQHGYLLPCGCSSPQFGGLERRYNFVELLKAQGWPVVALDLGDVPQMQGPAKLSNVQGLIKYRYAMEAMKRIGYTATSFGEYEATQPLSAAIDEYALNSAEPAVLAANLLKKDALFPDKERKAPGWGDSYVGSWQVTAATPRIKVGTLGVIGTHDAPGIANLIKTQKLPEGTVLPPSVGAQISAADRKTQFAPAGEAIAAGLKAMAAAGPDFRVLLYQGPLELAKLIPLADPQFNVILCLSVEDEPPGRPEVVGDTLVVRVGHKGKNVGVVGVFATGNAAKPFTMRYQLVPIGPEFATPEAKEKGHPILALMEAYTRELKRDDYLAKYGKMPHELLTKLKDIPALAGQKAGYVGSEACMKCHQHAYKIWHGSDHAHAYKTLVDARKPSLREYDAECIVCHTVGFRYNDGFANATATPKLKDVGCESCHGPGQVHKEHPLDKSLYALINPWKAPKGEAPAQKEKRQLRIETMCRDCHDAENDVNWKSFLTKWEKVAHPTPPDERQADE
jgi:hypothetical protein